MQRDRKHELRCFCSRKPLLAIYGMDERNRAYIHVRVYKQQRVFGDVVIYGGEVKILCRECLRWYKIHFREESKEQAELRITDTPTEVDSPARIIQAS